MISRSTPIPSMLRRARLVFLVAAVAACPLTAVAQGRVSGIVFDSISRHPLAGASIIATPGAGIRDSVFHSVTADASGRFAITSLASGPWLLSVEHPSLDSLGLTVPPREVIIAARDTSVTLGIPSPIGFARMACGAAATDTTGALIGRIASLAGAPSSHALVVASWSDFDVD